MYISKSVIIMILFFIASNTITFGITYHFFVLDQENKNQNIILEGDNLFNDFNTDINFGHSTDYRDPAIFTYTIYDHDKIAFYQIITNSDGNQHKYFQKITGCEWYHDDVLINILETEFPFVLKLSDCKDNEYMFLINYTNIERLVQNNSIFDLDDFQ